MPGHKDIYERNYIRPHPVVWLFLFFAAGLVLLLPILEQMPSALNRWAGTDITITGTVRESREGNSYLWLKADDAEDILYVSLPVNKETGESVIWYPAGSRLQLTGTLKLPQEQRNPGGFHEKRWLLSKEARIKLHVDESILLDEPKGIWKLSWKVQCCIKQTAGQYLDEPQRQLAFAVLLGEKQQLDPAFYRLTQRMGISHIFAVSGLHVGFVSVLLLGIFRLLHLERSWFSFIVLAAVVFFYCLMTGLAPSTIRAAVMLLLAAIAMRLLRPPAPVDFLALAGILLLADNPFLLYTAGFQLSFGVTLSLLLFVKPLQKNMKWIPDVLLRDSLAVVFAASLGSFPLTMWHFYTLSWLSPLYNLILVPMVSFAVPALLLAVLLEACFSLLMPIPGQILFFPAEAVLEILYRGTIWLNHAAGSGQIFTGRPRWPAAVCYIVFLTVLYYLLQKKDKNRSENRCENRNKKRTKTGRGLPEMICVFCLMGAVLFSVPALPEGDELLYLDAGQGSCAVFRSRCGETIVFDGGAKQKELLSVLAWYGVNRVDSIVLSHGDNDHISGLMQVIEAMPVNCLCIEQSQMEREEVQPLLNAAESCGVTVKPVSRKAGLKLKEWEIELAVYDDRLNETNSRELTAILKNPETVIAFPGDLGLDAVQQFLKSQPDITVWTVPHHGSRYSSSQELCQELGKKGVKLAVISAGVANRYGHPHPDVLQYLQNQNIPVYRTDQNGAVLLRADRF